VIGCWLRLGVKESHLGPAALLLLPGSGSGSSPSCLWTWYLMMMMMMMATRTSALDRVEAERHQADEPRRAYSYFGESLHQKRKRNEAHRVVRKEKCCPFASVPRRKKKGKLCSHAILNIGEE
jgi:hypothetical protein